MSENEQLPPEPDMAGDVEFGALNSRTIRFPITMGGGRPPAFIDVEVAV